MSTDRTPEENAEYEVSRAAAQLVLAETRRNLASWMLAEELDEPAEVCEEWVNRVWNALREGLDEEGRLLAILMLLESDAIATARQVRIGLESS